MGDENSTAKRRVATMKEHLAGIKGAQVEIQALAADHLLRSQTPISEQPVPQSPPTTEGAT